jgi:hypothetical protein
MLAVVAVVLGGGDPLMAPVVVAEVRNWGTGLALPTTPPPPPAVPGKLPPPPLVPVGELYVAMLLFPPLSMERERVTSTIVELLLFHDEDSDDDVADVTAPESSPSTGLELDG